MPNAEDGSRAAAQTSKDPLLFVGLVWLGTLIAGLRAAGNQRRFPFTDDWILVPFVTGDRSATFSWLWAPHGDHRIPLVKALFLVVYNRATTYDFRAAVVTDVVLLGAMAAALVLTAARLRGSLAYADAFFPLALLQWGLIAIWWSFALHYVCWLGLVMGVLIAIVRTEERLSFWNAVAAGTGLLLLPLCGTIGLVLVPPLALWLLLAGWSLGGRSRKTSLAAWAGGLGSLGVAGACLGHFQFGAAHRGSLEQILEFSVKFLSSEFGRAFAKFPRLPWYLLMPVLLLLSLGALAWTMKGRPSERMRAFGLLLFGLAMVGLAAAMGIGRGGRLGQVDVLNHYALLAVPLLVWTYLVWSCCPGLESAARFFQTSLFALMCIVFALNVHIEPYTYREAEERFVEDVHAGLSIPLLVERHWRLFYWQNSEEGRSEVTNGLRALQRAQVKPFDAIRDDGASR
jgi:hypothetical protein